MNILPLILFILLVLGLGSLSFLQMSARTFWEKKYYTSYMKVEREARNERERRDFQRVKSNTSKKAAQSTSSKENISYQSPREKKRLSDLTKLNLSPLFREGHSSLLYETAAELIRILYQKSALFERENHPKVEYVLLDALIAEGKKKEKLSSFSELYPEDEGLRKLFYKMCKGTKKGYPPFGDYFFLHPEKESKAIHFCFASKMLLQAVFGDKITTSIIAEEKKKWQESHKHESLTKSELETVLQTGRGELLSFAEIDDLMSYSKAKAHSPSFVVIDKETGISIKSF